MLIVEGGKKIPFVIGDSFALRGSCVSSRAVGAPTDRMATTTTTTTAATRKKGKEMPAQQQNDDRSVSARAPARRRATGGKMYTHAEMCVCVYIYIYVCVYIYTRCAHYRRRRATATTMTAVKATPRYTTLAAGRVLCGTDDGSMAPGGFPARRSFSPTV